jgi:hypothetical protein
MKISGFTFVRNADKLYFPIKESIESILPIVDEYIIALGKGDNEDNTEQLILSIQSPKIKIIYRVWDEKLFKDGKIFAHETNVALNECKGDWCFYLQADEVIHENDLPILKDACQFYLHNEKVDGFTLNYYHFYGDYNHYLPIHGWCRSEIRIIRNNKNIYSYNDANSFRKENNKKLRIIKLPAHVYHYGYVRPPDIMKQKKTIQDNIHKGFAEKQFIEDNFNYGNMKMTYLFKGSHPKVMQNRISNMSWEDKLYFKNVPLNRPKMKHEKIKYRIITFIENKILGGRQLFGYKNWICLGSFQKKL